MVSCSVFLPPTSPNGMGPKVRSSLVFARSLQHFWLPASHLLGTCYLLDDLRSKHTPSKYLCATYSHIYMCYVSPSCLLPVYSHNTTCVSDIPYLPYIPMIPYISYIPYELWPYIPYLLYLSCMPHIPYIWNIITTPPAHTIPNIHAIHTIPTLHSKHSIPIIVTIHTTQTIHTVISNIPYPTGLHTIPTIHTVSHPHHTTGGRGTVPHTHHTTGGRGTVLWLTHDHGRGEGGWNAGPYIHIHIL